MYNQHSTNVQPRELTGLDDAYQAVIPLLSRQVEQAKQKTEQEITRLTTAFFQLKSDVDKILHSHQSPFGGVSPTGDATEEKWRQPVQDLPVILSNLARRAGDVAYLGDKICLLAANLYQRVAQSGSRQVGDQQETVKTAMQLVVAAIEILEFSNEIREQLYQVNAQVPVLLKTLFSTVLSQREIIRNLQNGETPKVSMTNPALLEDIIKNIDQIIYGFQFQDQVTQTLDAVSQSMRDLLTSMRTLNDAGMPMVDLVGLMEKVKAHSVTYDQHKTMGDDDGSMKPGDVTFL